MNMRRIQFQDREAMVGNMIYLLYCKHLSDGQGGHEQMQTPHATFDGAYKHMQTIKKHYESKDFEVREVPDGSFYVIGPFGFKRMYYVATRTIEK